MSVTLRAGDSLLDSLSLSILVAARTVVCDEWTGGPERRDPFARLYVVMSGSGRITVRGRDWILGAGAVVLVPSDTPVVLHRARGLDHFWTHFTARVAAGLSLFSVFEPPVLIESGSDDARREATLVQAIVERGLGDPASRFAAHTRLRLLLEPFIERGRWSDRTEQLARFYPAIEYIAEHLAEPIRTSDIAETVNLHPTYFANRFAEATGVAP
ncbi:MAG: AraC family ligand binding domain-containing protein, partial [bacterium]